jgi:hypothetical protein
MRVSELMKQLDRFNDEEDIEVLFRNKTSGYDEEILRIDKIQDPRFSQVQYIIIHTEES